MVQLPIRKWGCPMKIEVWSDFVCPYCFLGKRNLELALEKFAHKENVRIKYRSFQLNDPQDNEGEIYVTEALSKKYGMPKKQINLMNEQLQKQGKEAGITLNFEKLLHIQTSDVHRIVKHAESLGQSKDLINDLFEEYFTNNKNISEEETLIPLAVKAGMEEAEAKRVFETCKYGRSVKEDIELAREFNVQGVPFFVINEKYAVPGAQAVDAFIEILESIWEQEGSVFGQTDEGINNTNYCHGDACERNS